MNEIEKLQQRIKELEEICLTEEENRILYDYQNNGIECLDKSKWSIITNKLMNFSVAKPYNKPISK